MAEAALHRASGRSMLSHVGRAIARNSEVASARAAAALQAEQQATAAQEAVAAALATEEAAAAAAAAARQEGKSTLPGWDENAPGEPAKVGAAAVDGATRKRMQAVLEALQAPMEACVDFALKYTKEGQQGALLAALPLWEEAVEAIREQQKGRGDELFGAAAEERCLVAARRLKEQCDDVATFAGTPFTKLFSPG